jgi:hypothetical protein
MVITPFPKQQHLTDKKEFHNNHQPLIVPAAATTGRG